jgi:hypothetical protein
LTEHPVRNEEEVGVLVSRGMEGKTMGANYRHEHSSRSHTVVRLLVESHHETDEKLTGEKGEKRRNKTKRNETALSFFFFEFSFLVPNLSRPWLLFLI